MHIVIRKFRGGALGPSATPFIHPTQAAAETEAQRLAEESPQYQFFVFSVGKGFAAEITVHEITHQGHLPNA